MRSVALRWGIVAVAVTLAGLSVAFFFSSEEPQVSPSQAICSAERRLATELRHAQRDGRSGVLRYFKLRDEVRLQPEEVFCLYQDAIGISDPDLRWTSTFSPPGHEEWSKHHVFTQFIHGFPVRGAGYNVHVREGVFPEEFDHASGWLATDVHIATQPTLSEQEALTIALTEAHAPAEEWLKLPSGRLIVWTGSRTSNGPPPRFALSWEFNFDSREVKNAPFAMPLGVWVDATTGEVLEIMPSMIQ